MNGRILAERLLATTSVAALAFAMMQVPKASASGLTIGPGASGPVSNTSTVTFVTVTGATVTGTVSNSGTVSPNSVSVINGSTINGGIVDSGVIHGGLGVDGSSLVHATSGSAINITSTGTLSGGITNVGRIVGPTTTTHNAIGIGVDGLVQGGITNSGSIVLNTNLAGFAGVFGIDIGNALPATVTSFGGGISNAGTISVNGQGNGLFFGIFADADTFTGDITNAAGGTIALTANGGGGAALDVAVGLFNGNFVNNGVVSTAVSATGIVHVSAVALGAGTMIGGVTNTGTISINASATGGAVADAFGLLGRALSAAWSSIPAPSPASPPARTVRRWPPVSTSPAIPSRARSATAARSRPTPSSAPPRTPGPPPPSRWASTSVISAAASSIPARSPAPPRPRTGLPMPMV